MIVMGLVMKRQELWLKAIEKRIAATTAMLGSMKGVKMCGLTEILRANLHDLRVQELEISKGFGKHHARLIWEIFLTCFSFPLAHFCSNLDVHHLFRYQ
jgi:ATP-binding cassette, subfamily C (CFTR/MRP), member 1